MTSPGPRKRTPTAPQPAPEASELGPSEQGPSEQTAAFDKALIDIFAELRKLNAKLGVLGSPEAPVPVGPGPPGSLPPGSAGADDGDDQGNGDDPRRVAHEVLGQAHAVLVVAASPEVLGVWCPPQLQDSVRETSAALTAAVGQVQVAVAGGDHDENLRRAGIGGPSGRPKRRGLRMALEHLVKAWNDLRHGGEQGERVLTWLKTAAGWAQTALGSLASVIPGAEVLNEALAVVLNGIDTREALATSGGDSEAATQA